MCSGVCLVLVLVLARLARLAGNECRLPKNELVPTKHGVPSYSSRSKVQYEWSES